MPTSWSTDLDPSLGAARMARARALARVRSTPLLAPYYDKLCALTLDAVDWATVASADEVIVAKWCAELDDSATWPPDAA